MILFLFFGGFFYLVLFITFYYFYFFYSGLRLAMYPYQFTLDAYQHSGYFQLFKLINPNLGRMAISFTKCRSDRTGKVSEY